MPATIFSELSDSNLFDVVKAVLKKSMRFRSALGVHKSGVYNFLSILLNASKTISAGNFDKPQLVNYCKGKEKAQERLVSCSWYLNPT